ncbi:hypothetical protein [Roseococcus thiosulfatophilus]|uniref:hypothetical protein n=1 Tax=Roseococcus thiosulfatophilus TaxID=35813 RepID=UPI001A90A72A|nr:hypothetical protein [Roseococcus thiosulfatophilus]
MSWAPGPGLMRWALAVVTLLAWSPILSVLTAAALADVLGCRLNEGTPHPCLLAGQDIGGTLYAMFVLGWLGLLTFPFALGTALAWAVLAGRALWRRFR